MSSVSAFYWEAFAELKTDRNIAFSVGPIPWSSIQRYSEQLGLNEDDYELFLSVLRQADNADRTFLNKPVKDK